jgi:hypothetical protein
MWHLLHPSRLPAEGLAPEAYLERAGSALACAFASSEEFEAAIIRAKRDAGVYGPRRRYRQVAIATVVATVLLTLLFWLI